MPDYENGKIPPSLLRRVSNFVPLYSGVNSNVGSDLLREDAWAALNMLQVAFLKGFERPLNVSEAYRGLTRQTAVWQQYINGDGPMAARPGTSNHGWALACDFASGVNTYGSATKYWMDRNAPRWGWHPVGNSFAKPEAWHFEFKPGTATETIPASGGATPFPEEDEDMPITDADLIKIRDFLWESRVFVDNNGTATVTMKEALGQAWMGGRDSMAALPQVKRAVDEATKQNVPLIYKSPAGQHIMAQPVVLDITANNGTGMAVAAQLARAARQGAVIVPFAEQADYDQWRIILLAGK